MRCRRVRETFDAYRDGELPPAVREAVGGHLAACGRCREALARHTRLRDMLADAAGRTAPPPDGFADRVMYAARRGRSPRAAPLDWNPVRWWRQTPIPMRTAAAAAVVIGLSIGLLMGWTSAPSAPQAGARAQPDPVDTYRIDYLGEAPAGSLANSYLALVSATDEGGR